MGVSRRARIIILLIVCPFLLAAIWMWFRPYDWSRDGNVGAKVEFVQIRRDKSFYWLDMRIDVDRPDQYDFHQPIHLVLENGKKIDPASMALEGKGDGEIQAYGDTIENLEKISLKFWLEESDFQGPMNLEINGGDLRVRSKSGTPQLEDSEQTTYHTVRW